MPTQFEQGASLSPPRDRRLDAVKIFVIAFVLLAAAALIILWLVRNNASPAAAAAAPAASAPAAPEARPPQTPAEFEIRINEFVSDDHYVVEAVTPGVEPNVVLDGDPLTHRSTLTISGAPRGAEADPARRYSRQEWQADRLHADGAAPRGRLPPRFLLEGRHPDHLLRPQPRGALETDHHPPQGLLTTAPNDKEHEPCAKKPRASSCRCCRTR